LNTPRCALQRSRGERGKYLVGGGNKESPGGVAGRARRVKTMGRRGKAANVSVRGNP